MVPEELKAFLDRKVALYNQSSFIENDPISIPHRFSKKQDIEVMGFFAATLAWGQRVTIINNCKKLIERFDDAPHDFILHHKEKDLRRFTDFKHRTFNATDLLYFIAFLHHFYQRHESLEEAFIKNMAKDDKTVERGLTGFYELFFSLEHPARTHKHVASPAKNSACKRLNMFLRWMVRQDDKGVDFGIWKKISPAQLLCPLDVHVDRVARKLGLLEAKPGKWKAVLELTRNLRELDPEDPVKYDFALFGLGVIEKLK